MNIPTIYNTFNWRKQLNRICKKISNLPIENCGISHDEIPFIKLADGMILYGPHPPTSYKKFYNTLTNDIKESIPWECFGVAMDIIIRYQEGGLQLGGPKKEENYILKKDDTLAEMGAYRGYYILNAAKRIGKNGRILAIEPIPENIKYLEKNVKENNLKNVTIVPKGVWKQQDHKTFFLQKDDMQSASIDLEANNKKTIEIEVDSLDNILKNAKINTINLMIIQLNGAEYEALLGLTTIQPENLAIAARYNKKDKSSVTLISNLLQQRGYNTTIRKKHFLYATKQK